MAFFCSFLVWFDFAPFATTIRHRLGLSASQVATIALANLGLTVPARVLVGRLVDRFGPRRVYAAILISSAVPNTVFALSSSFTVLVVSRLALSVVGAGFVVGIRMVAEWFPPGELGVAEGLYGGWGNAGAAAATVGLPVLAGWLGGPDGWRWATLGTGALAAAYGLVYLRSTADTPPGQVWERPWRQGALEVTHRRAALGLVALVAPTTAVVGVVAWRMALAHALSGSALALVLGALGVVLALQGRQVLMTNRPALAGYYPPEERYPLGPVVVLCLAYSATFGSELALLSLLPGFFAGGWHLGPSVAGISAGAFGVLNLVARPGGGLLSDRVGDRRRLLTGVLAGSGLSLVAMSRISGRWPLAGAVGVTMVAAGALQVGNGVVFSLVPRVKRRVGGQIAGLVGGYGNLGGVVFLTVALALSPTRLFLVMAGGAGVAALAAWRLLEPAPPVTAPSVGTVPVGTVPVGSPAVGAPAVGAVRPLPVRAPRWDGPAPAGAVGE